MDGNDLLNAFANNAIIQWLDFIGPLAQLCKTNARPREPLLHAEL